MASITKRDLLAVGGLALAATPALAQTTPGGPFVTRHTGIFNGRTVDYVATVGETILTGADGRPPARFVSTS